MSEEKDFFRYGISICAIDIEVIAKVFFKYALNDSMEYLKQAIEHLN